MSFFKGILIFILLTGTITFTALNYFGAIEHYNACYEREIVPVQNLNVIEGPLSEFKTLLGDDFLGYRNHIYRVFTYTMHFLSCDDTERVVEEKGFYPVIAAALVYHDIGLWTDNALSYLEPSIVRAEQRFRGQFTPEQLQLLDDIIYWHHKLTPFQGAHAAIVNAVRKADWIDATEGLITKGMPSRHIATVKGAIEEAGFHQTLLEFGPKLYGNNFIKIISELSGIMKF